MPWHETGRPAILWSRLYNGPALDAHRTAGLDSEYSMLAISLTPHVNLDEQASDAQKRQLMIACERNSISSAPSHILRVG